MSKLFKILLTITILSISNLNANILDKRITFKNSMDKNERLSKKEFLTLLLNNEYNINVLFEDEKSKELLEKEKMPYIKIINGKLKTVIDKVIGNELFYSFNIKNKTLHLYYNKTFNFTLNIVNNSITSDTSFSTNSTKITTSYKNDFWTKLKENLSILLKNIDKNNYFEPIIEPSSGLITVTGNKEQISTVYNYIKKIKQQLSKEVMIDIKIYTVQLSESHQTGINWSKLSLSFNKSGKPTYKNLLGNNSIFTTSVFNAEGFINFLAQNGNVNSISNPKIVTLSGQKALLSVGDNIYYKYLSGTTVDKNGNAVQNYSIENKFVGLTLDITPKIDLKDNTIILNLSPQITDFRDISQIAPGSKRDMPPDISKKTLNTIVKLRNNQTLILGGIITNDKKLSYNGVPILKEIPILGYLFKSKEKISNKKELIFVITPKIIDLNKYFIK